MSISSFLASGKEKNKTQEEKQSLAHEFLGRFHVVKAHQWRGKFPRIFCVGRNTVATIDPSALFKLTNEWKYGQQFFEALPKPASQQEFLITVGKGRGSGTETMTFASPDRAEVLTELQKQRKKFASRDAQSGQRFTTQKLHWNEEWAPCTLSLDAHGIVQLDAADADRPLGCYEYWLISSIGTIEDVVGGLWIRYSDMARLHVYQCDRKEELIRRICEMASKYIGHTGIATGGGLSVAAFEKARLGKVTLDELMSVSEFGVTKHTIRHRNPVRRQLCIAERHVVERDPATYSIVTARLLEDVFALIRCEEDSQQFNIEFKDNAVKAFNSTERDSLLAALLDGVRRAGNLHCCIKMSKTDRGQRAGTLRRPVPESTETTLLRVMGEYDVKADRDIITYPQLIRYFNNNVEYSGLVYTEKKDRVFAENKEKLQQTAITALLVHSSESPTPEQAADLFYALRRLAASRTGFEAFTRIPGFVRKIGKGVITGLKMRHDAVSHAAIDFLAALLYPMHDRYDSFQMQQNRLALLASQQFISNLVTLLRQHALANTGALVVSALLDFFVFALCPPYSGTTESSHFNTIVETLAEGAGPAMFRLYLHPCMALGIASGMLMKTIVQECETQASRLQRYALSEGTLLRQFYQAIWSKSVDQRELAIQLIALWTVECPEAQELFKRMLPVALLSFLQSKNTVPETADPVLAKLDLTGIASSHWRLKMGVPTALPQPPDQPPVVLRKSKNLVNVTLNWPYFFYQLQKDHTRPDVIWNHHTREELRESVSRELALLSQGTDTRRGHDIAWNHVEFEVLYECLKDEIRIGSHFLRILLEDPNPKIVNPREFFYDLYHRYLLVSEVSLKAQCMHGMARLYETYAADIGVFNDLSFIVGMVKTATDKLERDRLLLFLSNLLRVKGNVKLFIDCHGVPVLIDLLTLAHTHTDRAQLRTQANVIEMNPDHSVGSEPEWFYQDKSGEQQGPVGLDVVQEMYKDGSLTAESKLWAQGLDAWHAVKDVPQLKWSLIYEDAGCLNPTELSCLVLDMLIRMCSFYPTKNEDGVVIRPVPRIKRMLAQATVLPHIVQIFLTLDPGLVSRTAILLCALMEDNPGAAARLYLTGAFFFALMYMGSDIKPIVRLFHTCHDKQAFRSDEGTSVLSPMLPKAMVCFLCNHGIDKFSERFLGEFDDPETIWGTSMRQHLVQKIAVHLMDFTPKLRSNTRAIYTYCPITPVAYNQLENELFCNIYYLRHLCDTHRFPEWPITNKIELLRDTLGEWRAELEKKGTGSSISRKEALEALDIKVADDADTDIDPSKVRRAYFILAARYHPDKNPEGREKFEEILKAYEFLANPNQPSDFPDPKRIDLLMRTQSILYKRFKDELSPYKYAGYPMLLQHIGKEAADPQLFALETPLLPSASELCLHTVNASPLNAEELLREGGLQLLKTALERCSDVVVDTTTDSEMPALVSMRIVETFAVAADFESCRSVIQDMPGLVEMICKGITSKKAPRLAKASIACTSAFAAGESLQDQLYKAGVLWHLLLFIFGYDYTLDEGGVDKSADTNVQELKNVQAKAAIFTICRLCGFMNTTKPHAKFTESLSMLLTPYVVNRLHEECKGQPVAGEPTVLKLLNSNSETPYMLWNNGTRAELTDFLEKMQEAALKGHEVSAHFEYSSHKRELLVGGVFVRLYNEQPHFILSEPAGFVSSALVYIQESLEQVTRLEESKPMANIASCMEAIRNVLTTTPKAYIACTDSLSMMLSVLQIGTEEVCAKTTEVLLLCTQHHDVVVSIGEESLLTPAFLCITQFRSCVLPLLQLFLSLAAVTKCVAQMLDRGAYVLALYEFCTTRMPDIREAACQLVGKIVSDKLYGPKVSLRSGKIVLPVFIDMMKENAQGAALMFDSSSENPELIWNSDMRDRCIRKCTELREDIVAALSKDPNVVWRLPDSINAEKPIDEYEVGGVYLKLYVKQPAWDLRSPRKFLTALFEECLVKLEEDPAAEEEVELVSKSIVCLLNTRTVLADQVPQLGHLPKLFSAISKAKPVTSHAALQVVHQLASSKAVVESMGGMNSVQPLLDFMRASGVPDDQLGQVIETIERMMTKNNPERGCLVKKALDCDLPQELFNVLDKTSSSAVRAVAVKALKAMAGGSSPNCQVVREVLAENPKWETYQAQKHDLFLEKSTFSGYLTGPSSGGAMLSLTSGPAASSAAHSAAPPPISDNIKAAAAPLPTQRDAQPDTALSSLPPSNTAPPAPTPPAPTTPAPTTPAPTTPAPTTPAPTPPAPTTPAPTTPAPASPAPSPSAPSTPAPSTPVPSSSPIAPAPSVPAQQSASQPSTPDDCGRDIEEKEPQQKSEAAQPQPEPSDAEEEEAQQQPEVETSPSKEPATTKTRPTPTDGPPSATLDDSEDGKGNQDEGEGVHNKELSATRNNSSSTNSSDQPAEKPAGEVKATPGTDEEEEAGKQDAPPANGT